MRLWTIKYPNSRKVNTVISLFVSRSVTLRKLSKQSHEARKEKNSGFTSTIFLLNTSILSLKKKRLTKFTQVINFCSEFISVRGGRAGGGCSPPCRKEISIIRAKLMYCSGKDTVKNILLLNILIYLFSSRNSPNLLTDLCTTSRDGCYYLELEY